MSAPGCCRDRLLKNAHLWRWRIRTFVAAYRKYASLGPLPSAWHLDLFEHSGQRRSFSTRCGTVGGCDTSFTPARPVHWIDLAAKHAALAALHRSGVRIPAWFVLTPDAFDGCVDQRERRIEAPTPPRDLTADVALRAEPLREFAEALASLCPNGERVAVRSSAPEEDGRQHSFAGQLESFLFVPPAQVPEARGGGVAFRLRRAPPGVPPHPRPAAGLPPTGGPDPADGRRESLRRGVQCGPDHRSTRCGGGRRLLRPGHLPGVRRAGRRHVSGGSRRTSPGTRYRREAVRPPRGHRVCRRSAVRGGAPRGRPPSRPHRRRSPRGRGAGASRRTRLRPPTGYRVGHRG